LSTGIGTNTEVIENITLYGLLSGLLGARLGFLLSHPTVFLNHPLSLVSLTPSMLDASFGFLVAGITAFVIAQKKHLPLWPTLDALTPFFLLVFMATHLSNFANGNAYGLPTSLSWGIELWNETRHPVQLYAFLLSFGLLIFLLLRTRGLKITVFNKSGVLFNSVISSIALITIFTQAFVAEKILFGSIDLLQLVSLLVLVICLGLIYTRLYPKYQKASVIISMGSNYEPNQSLYRAKQLIQNNFKILNNSSRYVTQDINKDSKTANFLNQVIEIETDKPVNALIKDLKNIEKEVGRQHSNKHIVVLDLDLLTYGGEVFQFDGKSIPAHDMIKYRYLAIPLAEMLPGFRHPANGRTIQEILDRITDDSQVALLNEEESGLKK